MGEAIDKNIPSEALGFAMLIKDEVITRVGGKSKVTEGVTARVSAVEMDFVMILASTAEDWGN